MGSTKFRSEHDELARERHRTRTARDLERRLARSRKHTPPPAWSAPSVPPSRAARSEMTIRHGSAIDPPRAVGIDEPSTMAPAVPITPEPPFSADRVPVKVTVQDRHERPGRLSRRERDIAAFRERREQAVRLARADAARRIERNGELAAVIDALAAIRDPLAAGWELERQTLDQALTTSARETADAARRALRAISRDAARTSKRAECDPELALAVMVALSIVLRLARTAVRIEQRDHPTATRLARPFWR